MWGQADQEDLRRTWADELAGFEPADFRDALEVMRREHQDYPPTLYQFAGLCRDARTRRIGNTAALPPPRVHWRDVPASVKDEIAKLFEPGRKSDPKDWARQILRDAEAGKYTLLIGIEMAREALGVATVERQPGEDG